MLLRFRCIRVVGFFSIFSFGSVLAEEVSVERRAPLFSVGSEAGGSISVHSSDKDYLQRSGASKGDDGYQVRTCGDYWWLSGTHSWSWESYWAYLTASLKGQSSTSYGDAREPCDADLVVDTLEVYGETVSFGGDAQIKVRINRVVDSNSQVQKSNRKTVYGVSLNKGPCGAVVVHRATLHGITWMNVTKSGCGGMPGTI